MRPATLRAESSNNCCALRAGPPVPPKLLLLSISSCAGWPRANLQPNCLICLSTGRENSGSGSTRAPTHPPTSAHSSLQRTALRCTLTAMRHPRQPRAQHHWMPPGCPPSLQRSWKGCWLGTSRVGFRVGLVVYHPKWWNIWRARHSHHWLHLLT